MKRLQRFTRRKPLPTRVAGRVARRVGAVLKSVARVAASIVRR